MQNVELRREWLSAKFPNLAFEAKGALVIKLWNPRHPDQVLFLDPQAGIARVLWSHCAQSWGKGQAEDFSSWDDSSEPWPVAWPVWRDGWLRCLSQGTGQHARPGKSQGSKLIQLCHRLLFGD